MDGVRGYWTGRELLSKNGNTLSCPRWFIEHLPATISLDGELWMGRDNSHENISSILRSKDGDWHQIGYYIFDIPSSGGTYEERMTETESLESDLPPHVHIVKNIKRTGNDHLQRYLSEVVAGRGEGLMLREPNTSNQSGYTASLLKVKVISLTRVIFILYQTYEDTEMVVIAVMDGELLCKQ